MYLLVFILMALFAGWITGVFKKVSNSKSVKGRIISTEYTYTPNETHPTTYAIVEYSADGKIYQVKTDQRSSTHRVGQKRKVSYNSHDPQNAIVRPTITVYIFMLIIILIGIAAQFTNLFE